MDLLSGTARAVCFVPVQRPLARLGAWIASVAVAGTVGALGMLGYRRDGIGALFAAGGESLAPAASPGGAALVGLVIHVAWVAAWSALFAAFMQRGRRSGASIPAFIVA